jgi:hypothetical protein
MSANAASVDGRRSQQVLSEWGMEALRSEKEADR